MQRGIFHNERYRILGYHSYVIQKRYPAGTDFPHKLPSSEPTITITTAIPEQIRSLERSNMTDKDSSKPNNETQAFIQCIKK